jgi:hypothetical protein
MDDLLLGFGLLFVGVMVILLGILDFLIKRKVAREKLNDMAMFQELNELAEIEKCNTKK